MRFGKPAEGEPSRPPPLFPLSLSYPLPNLLDEGCPRQLCDVSLLHHVSVGFISAYLTRHVLTWCVRWANQKSKLFKKLISYPIQFITTWIHLVKWKRGKAAPWQVMPLDVGKELGKRLESRLDVLRFRSVCKNWRLSLPTPTLFPLRVPPPPDASDPNSAYFITELNILYNPMLNLYSRHIAVEELDHGGRFRRPMGLGFPCELHFNCPRGVLSMGGRKHRLLRMPFVGKVYFVRSGSIRSDHSVQLDSRYNPVRRMVIISGSNVISSNAEGVNPSYVRASDLSVVALFEGGEMDGRLAVLRLGGGGDNWNWDTGFCSHVFADIGSYKGKLSAIDHWGRVFLMDYHSLEMTQFAPSPSNVVLGKYSKKLFEIGGDLYLGDSSGEFFYFYKLDLQRRVWIGDGFAAQHIPKLEALGPAFRYWVENTGPSGPDLSWLAIPYMPRCYLLAFLSICARGMYDIYMCDPSLLACLWLNLIGFALIDIGS